MDPTAFDRNRYKDEMAKALGREVKDVEVTVLGFEILATYEFNATITADQAQTAIARSNGVPEASVEVSFRRRLSMFRRLASTVEATIKTTSAATAKSIKSSAASSSALNVELSKLGVSAIANVNVAPEVAVKTETKVTGAVVQAPDAARLAEVGAAVGGTVKVTAVQSVVAPSIPGPAPSPSSGSADGEDDEDFPLWIVFVVAALVIICGMLVVLVVIGVILWCAFGKDKSKDQGHVKGGTAQAQLSDIAVHKQDDPITHEAALEPKLGGASSSGVESIFGACCRPQVFEPGPYPDGGTFREAEEIIVPGDYVHPRVEQVRGDVQQSSSWLCTPVCGEGGGQRTQWTC